MGRRHVGDLVRSVRTRPSLFMVCYTFLGGHPALWSVLLARALTVNCGVFFIGFVGAYPRCHTGPFRPLFFVPGGYAYPPLLFASIYFFCFFLIVFFFSFL